MSTKTTEKRLLLQSNVSAEGVVDQEMTQKKLDARHRHWNSFASNGNTESPCIGAHYASSSLSRGSSVEMGLPDDETKTLRHDLLHTRQDAGCAFQTNTTLPTVRQGTLGLSVSTKEGEITRLSSATSSSTLNEFSPLCLTS